MLGLKAVIAAVVFWTFICLGRLTGLNPDSSSPAMSRALDVHRNGSPVGFFWAVFWFHVGSLVLTVIVPKFSLIRTLQLLLPAAVAVPT